MMNKLFYVIYAIILALVAIATGEIVTFVLLGLILMSLNTILAVLKEIRDELRKQRENKQ
ncbi:hypothetical protein J2S74_000013 [Evansella vedderi]|uniref:Uncharacterized protein n=1 Tax=Evansella vedderi TaxID=38282 RepID=A0ABT9ZPJ5_9BACI|nr:hypothetical protein [Evansella vedderi]MDQ0252641.1 hypothetical protein [Evansella vedderi]